MKPTLRSCLLTGLPLIVLVCGSSVVLGQRIGGLSGAGGSSGGKVSGSSSGSSGSRPGTYTLPKVGTINGNFSGSSTGTRPVTIPGNFSVKLGSNGNSSGSSTGSRPGSVPGKQLPAAPGRTNSLSSGAGAPPTIPGGSSNGSRGGSWLTWEAIGALTGIGSLIVAIVALVRKKD
jgi:hypothetical protein